MMTDRSREHVDIPSNISKRARADYRLGYFDGRAGFTPSPRASYVDAYRQGFAVGRRAGGYGEYTPPGEEQAQ